MKKRCDGCGLCIPQCAAGDLQIINGKARLIEGRYCGGLWANLDQCPQEALGKSRKNIPIQDVTITIDGEKKEVV